MPTPTVFAENWKRYRRWRTVVWVAGLALIGLAGLFFLHLIGGEVAGWAVAATMVFLWGAYIGIVMWKCPRCRRRGFQVDGRYPTPTCKFCGQRKFDDFDSNGGNPGDMHFPQSNSGQ